jgi:hypothetical protein
VLGFEDKISLGILLEIWYYSPALLHSEWEGRSQSKDLSIEVKVFVDVIGFPD